LIFTIFFIAFFAVILLALPLNYLSKHYPYFFWILVAIIGIVIFGTGTLRRVHLKEQLSNLDTLKIRLRDGITKDDLLKSYKNDEYERDPYFLLLSVMGSVVEEEPWDKDISDQVFNLDYECIEDEDSYDRIVKNFATLAGLRQKLKAIKSHVDLENSIATLHYDLDGISRSIAPIVDDDWADEATIMKDIESITSNDRRFWYIDNGQATIYLFIDDETAAKLNKLRVSMAKPVNFI
jgi:hypothetical protein